MPIPLDPKLARVRDVLGLPFDSAAAEIARAVLELAEAQQLQEAAAPPPKALSASERDYCARHNLSADEFYAKKIHSVRLRTPEQPKGRGFGP